MWYYYFAKLKSCHCSWGIFDLTKLSFYAFLSLYCYILADEKSSSCYIINKVSHIRGLWGNQVFQSGWTWAKQVLFSETFPFSKSKQIFHRQETVYFLFRSTNLFFLKSSLQNNDPFQHAASYERPLLWLLQLPFSEGGFCRPLESFPQGHKPGFCARETEKSLLDWPPPTISTISLPSFCHPFAISAFPAIRLLLSQKATKSDQCYI